MKRAGVRRLRRNLAVAIGNSGDPAAASARCAITHESRRARIRWWRSTSPGRSRSSVAEADATAGAREPKPGRAGADILLPDRSRRCRSVSRRWRPAARRAISTSAGTQTVFGEGPAARRRHAGRRAAGRRRRSRRASVRRPGRDGCSTARSRRRASIARASTSPTSSSTSSGSRAASGASTRSRTPAEIAACRPWLETEIALVRPRVLVCLGATAAQALLGKAFKVSQQRGADRARRRSRRVVIATVHPSSILRAPDDETRREEMTRFVAT